MNLGWMTQPKLNPVYHSNSHQHHLIHPLGLLALRDRSNTPDSSAVEPWFRLRAEFGPTGVLTRLGYGYGRYTLPVALG